MTNRVRRDGAAAEQKVWGHVFHDVLARGLLQSNLTVKRGYRCSRHYHEHRFNAFLVISGVICIESWPAGAGAPPHRQMLEQDESCVIAPGVVHRFRVVESGQVVETYWTDDGSKASFQDIIRYDEGGPDFD